MKEMYVWEPPIDRKDSKITRASVYLLLVLAGIALGYAWHFWHVGHAMCE